MDKVIRVIETLYICETNCWNCDKKMNAAYVKVEFYDDGILKRKHNIPLDYAQPQTKERIKKVAKENDLIIEERRYESPYGNNIYTVSVCPHCRKPFGNQYKNDLIGKEHKAIIVRDDA